jgi:putative lipoic acid-binding regulatory protein
MELNERGQLRFPCRYPVKALTHAREKAVGQVVEAVTGAGVRPDRDSLNVRPSRNGRFQSITIEVQADSRPDLEAVYSRLRALDVVVMTL